jgi:sulfite reductase (NADPH) flavoprotein alpha-component
MSDDALPIVAYGSGRGSSERIAKDIAGSLGVEAIQLNQLGLKVLPTASSAVFVCATINNGNVPRNADSFFRKLEAARAIRLRGLRFALLALGSSYYSTFCRAGDAIYRMLTDRDAVPFVPYARADKAASDLGQGMIDKLVSEVIVYLAKRKKENALQFTVIPPESVDLPPINFQTVPILGRSVLSAPDYLPSLTRLTIPVPPGVSYAAGGQVRILPQNDSNIVSQILAKFQIDPQLTLSVRDPLQLAVIPEKVIIRDLFLKYFDLSDRIPRSWPLMAESPIQSPRPSAVS